MALICDTGPLYAALDRSDASHRRAADLFSSTDGDLVVPAPVLVEVDWLLGSRVGPAATDPLFAAIEDGSIVVEDLRRADYRRIRDLCREYADLPLGLVDAAVMAVAERRREATIATLDHRHFSVVRPAHVGHFTLVP